MERTFAGGEGFGDGDGVGGVQNCDAEEQVFRPRLCKMLGRVSVERGQAVEEKNLA